MLSLLMTAWFVVAQSVQRPHVDVSKTTVGTPVVVAEIDTGKLKGEVRRLAWAPDGAMLYLQTAEGSPPLEALHHYSIAVAGGTISPLPEEPEWAARYWAVKQDRVAPGLESLVIDVVQGTENVKNGVGQAGVLDRESSPDAVARGNPSVDSLANGNMGNERAKVARLSLLGTDIATWTNERPTPGMRFSWGPAGRGALVYVGDQGTWSSSTR